MKRANTPDPNTPRAPHPIIGELAILRMAAGLATSQVGSHRNSVAGWETGRRIPTIQGLAVYADALGCDIVLVPKKDTTPATKG